MKERYVVEIEDGLHIRPISKMVEIALRYDCLAYLLFNDKCVNMKSIIEMILLEIKHNDVIENYIKGYLEKKTLNEIEHI